MDHRRKYMKYKAKYLQFKHNNTYVGGGKDEQEALINELRTKLQLRNPQLYNQSDANKINEIATEVVARNADSSVLPNSDEYYNAFETAVRNHSSYAKYLERDNNRYVTEAQQREADKNASKRAQTLSARQAVTREEADRMRDRLATIKQRNEAAQREERERNEAAQREERERPRREREEKKIRLDARITELEDQRIELLANINTSLGPQYKGCLEAHSTNTKQTCEKNGCVWNHAPPACNNSLKGRWTSSNGPYVEAQKQIKQLDITLTDLRQQLQAISPF
jgi:hypothetical protein